MTRTARRGASSWRGCRARWPSAASSTCCARASSTEPITSISSTARRAPATSVAVERYAANRFSVTRQLRYSRDETQLALDLGLFINGLPVATFELKNNLTKQTAEDAVEQYKRDRDPRELLFQFGRCMVHFAVDDQVVRFCTELKGKQSWFLPFDQGYQDGAGNPPNPEGPEDRLPVEAHPHASGLDRHHRELRADRRREGSEDRARRSASRSSRATTSSTSCASCSPTASRAGRRAPLPDPALSRQRQVELHRLAGPPAHRLWSTKRPRMFDSIIVVTDRLHPRQADPRHHQAVRPGRLDGRLMPSDSGDLRQRASRAARRSSSRRSRSSPSSTRRSATSTAATRSPSSSTRRTPARAARRPPR